MAVWRGPMGWISTDVQLPREEVLVWVDSKMRIAVFVGSRPGTADLEPFFMDARSDELLSWPSHWHALPPKPLNES
jgi:hypothetical protein